MATPPSTLKTGCGSSATVGAEMKIKKKQKKKTSRRIEIPPIR
jgi:hypothetical protein